jgi:hypothetical protein
MRRLRVSGCVVCLFCLAHTASAAVYDTYDVILNVNPSTGAVGMHFNSAVNIAGLEIDSPSGQLLTANYQSMTAHGYPGWTTAPIPLRSTVIADENVSSYASIPANTDINLGNIFAINGTRDLEFSWMTGDTYELFGYDVGYTPPNPSNVIYQSVPEPSTIIIWSLLGGLGLAAMRWRKRKAA